MKKLESKYAFSSVQMLEPTMVIGLMDFASFLEIQGLDHKVVDVYSKSLL